MKHFLFSFSFGVFSLFSLIASERRLTSVVRRLQSPSLSSLYQSIYQREQSKTKKNDRVPMPEPSTSAEEKLRICDDLTNSDTFNCSWDWDTYVSVNMDEIYDKLSKEKKYIFEKIYGKTTNRNSKLEYKNPYIIIGKEILFRESSDGPIFRVVKEYLFICVAKVQATNELVPFYVTQEYNTSEEGIEHYVAGRFVFIGDLKDRKQLYLVALAEESAIPLIKYLDIENYYLQKRKKGYRSEDCRRFDPTRLCTSLFSSSYFKNRSPKVVAQSSYKLGNCIKKEISFQSTEVIETYYEWMILCRGFIGSGQNRRVADYYVSQASDSSQVFVYRTVNEDGDEEKQRVYLENLSSNISTNLS